MDFLGLSKLIGRVKLSAPYPESRLKSLVDHLCHRRIVEIADDTMPVVRPVLYGPIVGDRGIDIEISLVERIKRNHIAIIIGIVPSPFSDRIPDGAERLPDRAYAERRAHSDIKRN